MVAKRKSQHNSRKLSIPWIQRQQSRNNLSSPMIKLDWVAVYLQFSYWNRTLLKVNLWLWSVSVLVPSLLCIVSESWSTCGEKVSSGQELLFMTYTYGQVPIFSILRRRMQSVCGQLSTAASLMANSGTCGQMQTSLLGLGSLSCSQVQSQLEWNPS